MTHQANELYEKALRFMERGKGHGEEGKKAAYRLIDEAHKLGHNDAKKLTGEILTFIWKILSFLLKIKLFRKLVIF